MTNTGRYIRAVLWDMDGTFMDSQPLWDESFRNCSCGCSWAGGWASERISDGYDGIIRNNSSRRI